VVTDNSRDVLADAKVLSQVGGLLSVQVARPASSIQAQTCDIYYVTKLRNNQTLPDGKHVVVRIDTNFAICEIHDWELRPIAEFVESGCNGMVSLERNSISGQSRHVAIHVAFQDSLLALRLIQADLIQRNVIASVDYLPSIVGFPAYNPWAATPILGPGEVLPPHPPVGFRLLSPLRKATADSTVLTDVNHPVTFSLRGQTLILTGAIRYFAWNLGADGKVLPDSAWNSECDQKWEQLRTFNPIVITAAERAFKTAAFFRYIKQRNPESWERFLHTIQAQVQLDNYKTPGFLVPLPRRTD
jgi:hypothetical protein